MGEKNFFVSAVGRKTWRFFFVVSGLRTFVVCVKLKNAWAGCPGGEMTFLLLSNILQFPIRIPNKHCIGCFSSMNSRTVAVVVAVNTTSFESCR